MIRTIEHLNLRVSDLPATLAFYERVLGLRSGPVPGDAEITDRAWLFAGNGQAIFHVGKMGSGMVEIAEDDAGTGIVDHLALECEDYDGMRDHLAKLGVDVRLRDVPAAKVRQIYVFDPDGLCLELNFRG